jgi:hypothetical protein
MESMERRNEEPVHGAERERGTRRVRTTESRWASEVYRTSGGLRQRWRVWEVGPGDGLPSHIERTGTAFTKRGARRAVSRAIRILRARRTSDAEHVEAARTHPVLPESPTPTYRPTAAVTPALAPPVERVETPSGEQDPAGAADERLAAILNRVEEVRRRLSDVVEELDASAEALDPEDPVAPEETDVSVTGPSAHRDSEVTPPHGLAASG